MEQNNAGASAEGAEEGNMDSEKIVDLVKKLFEKRACTDFCGCYEGDIEDIYEKGVIDFCTELKIELEKYQRTNG